MNLFFAQNVRTN